MFFVSFSFFVTMILNNCDSTLGDIVITIKSEEGVPRKYEFTVQSSQSHSKPHYHHVDDDVSVHKPLTVYVPPPTTSSYSTTSKPQIYSPKSKYPPVHYKLPPLVKKKRPTYSGKGKKKTRNKSRKNLTRSRPRTRVRRQRKPPKIRQNLFENILRRYRG